VLDWSLVGIGLGIGVAVAAPIGPINIMIIHRAVRGGFWPAFTAGLGATIGDGFYAAVAAFGISAISDVVQGHATTVKLLGGLLLIGLGLFLFTRHPTPMSGLKNDTRFSQAGAGAVGFFLALANPATLFAMAAVFSGLDELAGPEGHLTASLTLTLSAVTGSFLWVLALTMLVSRYRTQLNERWLRAINIASGLMLATFGGLLLATTVLGDFW
jgi:threonine/homoserine/homoserine lactone efflux protein